MAIVNKSYNIWQLLAITVVLLALEWLQFSIFNYFIS